MDTITKVFCEVLAVDQSQVNDQTSYNSFPAWDSLKHLEIISRLEEEFGIEITMDDITAMESLGKIKEIVQKYLDAKK